jgi:hypothetical protein
MEIIGELFRKAENVINNWPVFLFVVILNGKLFRKLLEIVKLILNSFVSFLSAILSIPIYSNLIKNF